MKLNVVFRPSLDPPLHNSGLKLSPSSSSSLFARLDPSVAHNLYQQALRNVNSDKPSAEATVYDTITHEININKFNLNTNSYWNISKNGNQTSNKHHLMVEFLPLAVTPFVRNSSHQENGYDIHTPTIYVSYNGGNIYFKKNQMNSYGNRQDEGSFLNMFIPQSIFDMSMILNSFAE